MSTKLATKTISKKFLKAMNMAVSMDWKVLAKTITRATVQTVYLDIQLTLEWCGQLGVPTPHAVRNLCITSDSKT